MARLTTQRSIARSLSRSRRSVLKGAVGASAGMFAAGAFHGHGRAQITDIAELAYLFDPSLVAIPLITDYLNGSQFSAYNYLGSGHFFYGPNVVANAINAGVFSQDGGQARQQIETPASIVTASIIQPTSDGAWTDTIRTNIETYISVESARMVVDAVADLVDPSATDRSDLLADGGHLSVRPFTFENGAQGTEVSACVAHRTWHAEFFRISPDPALTADETFLQQSADVFGQMATSVRKVATLDRFANQILALWGLDDLEGIAAANRPVRFENGQSFNIGAPKYSDTLKDTYGTSQEDREALFDYFLETICAMSSSEAVPETNPVGYSQTTRNFVTREDASAFFEAQMTPGQDRQHALQGFDQVEDDAQRTADTRFFYGILGTDPASRAATYGWSLLAGSSVVHLTFVDLSAPAGFDAIDQQSEQWQRLKNGAVEVLDSYRATLEIRTESWPEIPVPEVWQPGI